MSESSKQSADENSNELKDNWLDLPDPGHFVSHTYPVSLEMILKLSEEQLPYVTARPGFHERRLADKVDVPFEL